MITDGKQKKAILLAAVGNNMFKHVRNLFGWEDPKAETTTLENICKRVKDHLSTTSSQDRISLTVYESLASRLQTP